jgi:hypothetical protein
MEGAVTSALTLFGQLELHTLVDFRLGHKVFDVDRWLRCTVFQNCEANFFPERFDPVYVAGIRRPYHSVQITDADFASLREVSLTYRIPERWARGFGAQSANLVVAARNLHMWTKYSGLDPQVGRSFYGLPHDWLNYASVPQLAQFVTTVKVGF